jgi:hypothetical protein
MALTEAVTDPASSAGSAAAAFLAAAMEPGA